jgi:membrane-associated phospholipid phosphatase
VSDETHSRQGPGTVLTAGATAVTYLLNPLLLPVAGYILIAHVRGSTPVETMCVALIGLAFFKVIPLVMLGVLLRYGRIESVEVRSRERRTLPFLLGMASMTCGSLAFLFLRTDVATVLFAVAAISVASAGILTIITLWWKISIHAAGAGAFLGLILFFAVTDSAVVRSDLNLWPAAMATLLLVPLVAWSRVYLRAHTSGQVIAGSIFGFIMSVAPLYLLVMSGVMPPSH